MYISIFQALQIYLPKLLFVAGQIYKLVSVQQAYLAKILTMFKCTSDGVFLIGFESICRLSLVFVALAIYIDQKNR